MNFLFFIPFLLGLFSVVSSISSNLTAIQTFEEINKLPLEDIFNHPEFFKLKEEQFLRYIPDLENFNNSNFAKFRTKNPDYFTSCPYDFKVYVYDLPSDIPSVLLAEVNRQEGKYHVCPVDCNLAQFTLEYVLNDFFLQFCGRVTDPEEADFFYLPLVKDAEYRFRQLNMGNYRPSSLSENALLNAYELNDLSGLENFFQIPLKYWKRYGGYDHIVAIATPVSDLRHQSVHLTQHFLPFLYNSIFFSIEYSSGFYTNYKECLDAKNLLLPYPIVNPQAYNGENFLHSKPPSSATFNPKVDDPSIGEPFEQLVRPMKFEHFWRINTISKPILDRPGIMMQYETTEKPIDHMQFNMLESRSHLTSYAASAHGSCVFVRKAMGSVIRNATLVSSNYALNIGIGKRFVAFRSSTFCVVPVGDSASSNRMFELLTYGCIPVLLSDEVIYPFTSPMDNFTFSPHEFSIQMPQNIVYFHPDFFLNTTQEVATFLHGKQKMNPSYNTMAITGHAADQKLWHTLPISKRHPLDLLRESFAEKPETDRFSLPALIRILERVPEEDIITLRKNAIRISREYQYYKSDTRMSKPPISSDSRKIPDGRVFDYITEFLSARKRMGISNYVADATKKCSAARQAEPLKRSLICRWHPDLILKDPRIRLS